MRGISMRGVLQLGGVCFVVAMVALVHVGSRVRAAPCEACSRPLLSAGSAPGDAWHFSVVDLLVR
jgi:hypothetical protein